MPHANNDCSMIKWSMNASTVAGEPTGLSYTNEELLRTPFDAFIDSNDILYVLDSGNYRLRRYVANDTIGTLVINGSHGSELNQFGEST